MNHFSELSLRPVLQDNLLRHGFATPTPVQAETIPAALAGRDIVATAQTGTGKTLAFVLPLLESLLNGPERRGIQALVLSPTRELAMQTEETLARMASGTGIRSVLIVGGMSEATQLRSLRSGARVAIATPGRLCDFLRRRLVKLDGVQMLVLDEADRMLDMGFQPSIQAIVEELPETRQTLFFSATVEKSASYMIDTHARNPVRVTIGSVTKPVERIDFRLYEVEPGGKLELLTSLLGQEQGSFLVFARTKRGTDRLADSLAWAGVQAGRIHGDRTQSQRNQALARFKDGNCRVLIATDVAARGLHVEGIAHVVNYDLPQEPEDFIHRVGRTARAGARGTASTFSTRSERTEVRRIERALNVQLTPWAGDAPLPPEPVAVDKTITVRHAHARTSWSFSPGRRGRKR